MGAQHTAIDVADQFIRLSVADENPISHMQVQKLTFLAHAWGLGLGYGPLFQDAVEAWQYGPVIRMLYHALKHHGGKVVREELLEQPAEFSQREDALVRAIWRITARFLRWTYPA